MATRGLLHFTVLTAAITLASCASVRPPAGDVAEEQAQSQVKKEGAGVERATATGESFLDDTAAPDLALILREKGLSQLESQRTLVRKSERSRLQFRGARRPLADIVLPPPKGENDLRIHFLPVGAGVCQLVECPGRDGVPMLVDCGSTRVVAGIDWTQDAVSSYIQGILKGRQVNVVVSHPDADHYKFIPGAIPATQVHSLWMGGHHGDYPASFLDWANQVRDLGTASSPRVMEPFPVNWHNDGYAVAGLSCGVANTYVVGVNNGTTKNDHSLMLSIDYGDFRALFPGDATGVSQDAAVANFPGDYLYSTVLVASHHGADSHGSNNERWANATLPQYVVYPSGASYGHPRCNVVETYRAIDQLVPADSHGLACGMTGGTYDTEASELGEYNTHQSGAIIITSDPAAQPVEVLCLPNGC
ncbi:hypothetical protein IB223_14595 [Pseudoxanthomonas sp. PXM03]|uniref:ComEC/Rec2 family competence protein n=1 Tax=Pseudoxanthomonas sp. PXM03 TaxID=2769284 RepID=UPI0017831200|nr:hypothetical protein [Pseudoxanthomonas sp. PXM03]MBD9437329.1 hypothetical protein [Pseudoxanthomonas sp. PXM03]